MRITLALAMVVTCSVCCGQHPYAVPPAYGYFNKYEAMQQQGFENQLRLRQQREWEKRNPERSYVLDYAEQATRIRANKEQERYYQHLNDQMKQERRSRSMFYNPYVR